MATWYDKYMSVYDKPFNEVPEDVFTGIRERFARLQSTDPLASIVIIAYNEEKHLPACLWSLSEILCNKVFLTVEILQQFYLLKHYPLR